MAGYRQSNPDRAKAALAALLVHAAIGAAFLTGLVVNVSKQEAEVLDTFDVAPPPPPPLVVEQQESAAKGDPGDAGKKAEPTPVVAPKPRIEVPAKPPIAAAPVAGQGAASSAGAAIAGSGTGAGGSGSGRGGGGAGGAGTGIGSDARLLGGNRGRVSRHLLRPFAEDHGYAHLLLTIADTGRVTGCTVIQGTGIQAVDQAICGVMSRSRWAPARNKQGQPITVQVRYTATWSKD
jgi:periplasmic protein TonB